MTKNKTKECDSYEFIGRGSKSAFGHIAREETLSGKKVYDEFYDLLLNIAAAARRDENVDCEIDEALEYIAKMIKFVFEGGKFDDWDPHAPEYWKNPEVQELIKKGRHERFQKHK